eukprot:TRINITY_DN3619_c0_g1_i6.p1 TRINITY_DN3619_c0_g1~~TRINITY_DN3619_c0_g1_i6.p1  ORF type:complete len:261 (+),score=43.43 TRINITY_DN3619_c0_g1_i6:70-783(+)
MCIRDRYYPLQNLFLDITLSMDQSDNVGPLLTYAGMGYVSVDEILEDDGLHGAIYLGNLSSAVDRRTLKNLNIKAVLSICTNTGLQFDPTQLDHLVIEADDVETFDLSVHFEKTYEFIETQRNARKNILVHCLAGVSRSSTIVIAYLMKKKNMPFEKALKFVKKKRFVISPNLGFGKQLIKYEKTLREPATPDSSQQGTMQHSQPTHVYWILLLQKLEWTLSVLFAFYIAVNSLQLC